MGEWNVFTVLRGKLEGIRGVGLVGSRFFFLPALSWRVFVSFNENNTTAWFLGGPVAWIPASNGY